MDRRITALVATVAVVAGALATFAAVPAGAVGSCRRYEIVTGSYTWMEARDAARAMGGHLAIVTSAREEACIEARLWSFMDGKPSSRTNVGGNAALGRERPPQVWIGGSDRTTEGVWRWTTPRGRERTFFKIDGGGRGYTDWIQGVDWYDDQPDDGGGGGQDCLTITVPFWMGIYDYLGWDDDTCFDHLGFVVEF